MAVVVLLCGGTHLFGAGRANAETVIMPTNNKANNTSDTVIFISSSFFSGLFIYKKRVGLSPSIILTVI